MSKIKSCFLEIADNENVDEAKNVNKYMIYSSILDRNIVTNKLKKAINLSSDEEGYLDFDKFEETIDKDKYLKLYKVTDFTSSIYNTFNNSLNSYHYSMSYENIIDDLFDIPIYVDMDKSVDNGDGSLEIFINLSESNMVVYMKDFNIMNDICFYGLKDVLTNIEAISVLVFNLVRILYNKCNGNKFMIEIMIITALPELLEMYCENIDVKMLPKE